jgi:creatinine amidohydrolase/Fe(II)-dependent formamide hydrolase-like protein
VKWPGSGRIRSEIWGTPSGRAQFLARNVKKRPRAEHVLHKTAVIEVGSTEQHGPHLPTMTDARIGDEVAHRVALILGHALQAKYVTARAAS